MPEITVYGDGSAYWKKEGKWDMQGCKGCAYGEFAKPAPGDPKTGPYFGALINHFFNHRDDYY